MIPEYLELVYVLSVIGAFISGVVVLAAGAWQSLGLKFACVAVSSMCAGWLLLTYSVVKESEFCGIGSALCIAGGAFHVAVNTCFIGFHVAVGRDAIRLKSGERRRGDGRGA